MERGTSPGVRRARPDPRPAGGRPGREHAAGRASLPGPGRQEIALDAPLERPLSLAYLGDPNSVHTRRWITFFAERGHRVHLLVPDDQPIEPGLDERIRVGVFTISRPLPIRGLASLRTRRSLGRALHEARPDVLHAHFLRRYGWMANLSGFRPFAITVWGSDVFGVAGAGWWTRRPSSRALAAAALVTADSRALADAAIELGARPERVHLIQFGVDPERFRPGPDPDALRRRLDATGRRVVLAPREMRPLYRQDVVVAALAELPGDVIAVFGEGGQDPDERARLEAQAAALGVRDRLRFVPAIPHGEMPDYYRLAGVVVSVPESDAWPVTAFEAMASGVPIVMSDLPSAREGLAGLDPEALVPVGDPAATARTILARLDASAADRAALAARFRAAAIERGSTRLNLLRVEDEYRRLTARG
ncbi:MAG: glycosyltransferase [Chloroflexi bacterium]|nr:glycosyltransferase [Chloroflexota bacterium]